VLTVVGIPTGCRKREAELGDVTSESFPLSMVADQCVPLSRPELSKQNDEELMVCIKARQRDAKGLLFQSRCLFKIPARSKEFSSALYLAAETALLEAL
jgi:hypothetical protein